VLWENLHRLLDGRPLIPYEPQSGFLKLLNTGDGRAIGEYQGITFSGRWTWRLKDRIDGRFMDKYQDYGMRNGGSTDPHEANRETSVARPSALSTRLGFSRFRTPYSTLPTSMKCAGCGCKLGADVLARVLRRLDVPHDERVLLGLDAPDDAAVLKLSGGRPTVVTTDFFTAPLDDPYLNGRIAALNAASDAFAMGAQPVAALANVTIPEGPGAQQEELLFQVLAGSLREFTALRAALVGGHTIEGSQLTVGFTLLAEPMGDALCTRSALRPGDVLLLTKPLGVGVLLAAHRRAACPAGAFASLVATMLQGNACAARVAVTAGIRAMTDVTGFGLAGHLLEMLRASQVSAELTLEDIPLLPGAAELLAGGMESTLAPANRRAEAEIAAAPAAQRAPAHAAVFDPQTSGGLLIGIPSERGPGLLAELQRAGIPACRIGRVTAADPSAARLKLL
jgi:selenide,water dikinase